jgi:hypothetical protein
VTTELQLLKVTQRRAYSERAPLRTLHYRSRYITGAGSFVDPRAQVKPSPSASRPSLLNSLSALGEAIRLLRDFGGEMFSRAREPEHVDEDERLGQVEAEAEE